MRRLERAPQPSTETEATNWHTVDFLNVIKSDYNQTMANVTLKASEPGVTITNARHGERGVSLRGTFNSSTFDISIRYPYLLEDEIISGNDSLVPEVTFLGVPDELKIKVEYHNIGLGSGLPKQTLTYLSSTPAN